MALVSVAECKQFRDASGSEHDAELARLIPVVEATLEQMCGRGFGQEASRVDYFSGGRAWDAAPGELRLTRPPVRTIASVYDDPARVYGALTLVPSTSYVLIDPEAGIIAFDGYRPRAGLRNLKITYDGGFLPTDPAVGPLKQVIIEQVWMLREKGANNLIGVRSRSVADGNIQYFNLDLTPEQERTLNLYRLDVVV